MAVLCDSAAMEPATRRSARIVLSVAPALSLALTGCAAADPNPEPTHQAICVDPETEQRVEDDECDDGGRLGVGGWYFLAMGARFAGVGQLATGGSRQVPSTSHVRGGLPTRVGGVTSTTTATRGTAVSRGGFGTSAGSSRSGG